MDLVNYFDQIAKRIGGLDFSRKVVNNLLRNPDFNWCRGKQAPEPSIMLLSSGMLVEQTPSYRMTSGSYTIPSLAFCLSVTAIQTPQVASSWRLVRD